MKHGAVYANLPEVEEVFSIGMTGRWKCWPRSCRAAGRGGEAGPLKVLARIRTGEVQVMPGKYGPYVKWEKVNATLPKGVEPEAVTLEERWS